MQVTLDLNLVKSSIKYSVKPLLNFAGLDLQPFSELLPESKIF